MYVICYNGYTEFPKNMEKHNFTETVDYYKMCQSRFFKDQYLGDNKLSYIFIDNDHTYKNTKMAVENLWPSLTNKGYMLLHDYQNPGYPGVEEYVDSFVSNNDTLNACRRGCIVAIQKL